MSIRAGRTRRGATKTKPINCLDWYTAFAFCAWDGGRLATEAEWNYAASGGSEHRYYPWSKPATSTAIDDSYAVYCGGNLQPAERRIEVAQRRREVGAVRPRRERVGMDVRLGPGPVPDAMP